MSSWGIHSNVNGDGSSHNTVHYDDENWRHSWENDGQGNITEDHEVDQNTKDKIQHEDSYSSNNMGLGNNSYSIDEINNEK